MQVTILGAGGPPSSVSLGGQSMLVHTDADPILIDCGPATVERLFENGIQLSSVENVLFTHQHMDHNASFFHFAITGWMYGRDELSVYGPEGTEALLDALADVYREDLEYRRDFGRPVEGITDIDYTNVSESFATEIGTTRVTARPVDHTIETYAYKIEGENGTVVYSADTGDPSPLEGFAQDADVLVHNCGLCPEGTDGTDADHESWRQYLAVNPAPSESPVADQHCTPEQAATVGANADVDTLILTHLLPSYDRDAIIESAAGIFDGTIHVAEPGLTVDA